MQGLGKGGALSLVLIVQATAEEVRRVYYKSRHTPGLRWSDTFLQGLAPIYLKSSQVKSSQVKSKVNIRGSWIRRQAGSQRTLGVGLSISCTRDFLQIYIDTAC